MSERCAGVTVAGRRCGRAASAAGYCRTHAAQSPTPPDSAAAGAGELVADIDAYRRWVGSLGAGVLDRFGPQLGEARALAARIEAGDISATAAYGRCLESIRRGIDATVGRPTVDALTSIWARINETAAEEARLGW